MEVIRSQLLPVAIADSAMFTGQVMRTEFLRPSDENSLAGLSMTYQPGARSFWHVHEQEQVIVAVSGLGLVCWEGLDAPQLLESGDWWHVTPGIPHWHGATPGGHFTHLAITAGGGTQWLGEVSESAYRTPPVGADD